MYTIYYSVKTQVVCFVWIVTPWTCEGGVVEANGSAPTYSWHVFMILKKRGGGEKYEIGIMSCLLIEDENII